MHVWRWYRIRFWFLVLSPISWMLSGPLLERSGHVVLGRFVFPPLFAVLLFPAFFGLIFFRCPRCRAQFIVRGKWTIVFERRCQTCGLRVGESPDPSRLSSKR